MKYFTIAIKNGKLDLYLFNTKIEAEQHIKLLRFSNASKIAGGKYKNYVELCENLGKEFNCAIYKH